MYKIIEKMASFKLNYKKEEIVKNAHDNCEYLGYLVSGSLRIINYYFDGKESIIKTISPNNFFGNHLIYSTNNHYPGFIIASSNSKIIYIKRERFEKELQENSAFLQMYLKLISKQVIEMQRIIKINFQTTLKEKIYALINYKCEINNSNFFTYKSQDELAQFLNIPRASFSRTLNKLVKEKLIFKKNKTIYIL